MECLGVKVRFQVADAVGVASVTFSATFTVNCFISGSATVMVAVAVI